MFCRKCGAENQESASYCLQCGAKLTGSDTSKWWDDHRVRLALVIFAAVLLVSIAVIVISVLRPVSLLTPEPGASLPPMAGSATTSTSDAPASDGTPTAPSSTWTPVPADELGTSNLYIEYILDASGSMKESLPDGSVKLEVARDLLSAHLQAFRPETNIGLRAYGHRVDYRQTAESCQDIELIASVEQGQLETIVTWLHDFQAQGMTPLAESIRLAMRDFSFEPGRINSIVMISDGEETCDGDPCRLVEELKAQGINFTIHVIGLDVDESAREQLMCIAQAAGGTYHDARGQRDLRDALAEIDRALQSTEAITPPRVATPTPIPPTATNTATVAPTEPTVSPTPTSTSEGRIAFWSDREGTGGIYLMHPDGSDIHRLVSVASSELACLPDGKHVGFVDSSGDDDGYDIRVVNVDSGEETRLRGIAGLGFWTPLSWSPDGLRITFSTLQPHRDSQGIPFFTGGVVVMNSDGSNPSLVREGGSVPSWSPDGSQLAFVWNSFVNDTWESGIGLMSPAGNTVKTLVVDASIGSPTYALSWSPDTMRLAMGGQREPGIYVINVHNGQIEHLSDKNDQDPHWSPDGSRIVFQRLAENTLDIYVMNADGSGLRNLTSDAADDWFPCWLP